MLAGEPSVVQKIVGGLAQSPVAVTVTAWPGSTALPDGLNEMPGVWPSCARAVSDAASNTRKKR
jgi:hypothetical protein